MDIAIIDSGIGGMCLLPYFFKYLPFKKYVYFADAKNLPYGLKSTKRLLSITIENVKTIIKKYKPKIIVFGCNTIGVSIFESIKKIFPYQKFFSIKPNIDYSYSKNKKTLVIATNKTIKSIKENIKNKNIILCKMQALANKIENNLQNLQNIVPYLKRKLLKYKDVDCIVLGCTHYYFVKNQIQNIFKNVEIIDGIEILTNEVLSFLSKNDFIVSRKIKPKVKLVFSKKIKLKNIYKKTIKNFVKTSCIEKKDIFK